MGLFEKIFPRKSESVNFVDNGRFQLLSPYRPSFTNWDGCLYEVDLIRAVVDAKARNLSKLKS